jgi:hypothetical protein
MDFIQFTMPQTLGEALAWATALSTFLIGLMVMFVPKVFMTLTGLSTTRADGLAQLRGAFGGMLAGFGLACLMLSPQPLLYFALGLALSVAVLGRILSFLADKSRTVVNLSSMAFEAAGAFFTFAYVFGLIA